MARWVTVHDAESMLPRRLNTEMVVVYAGREGGGGLIWTAAEGDVWEVMENEGQLRALIEGGVA